MRVRTFAGSRQPGFTFPEALVTIALLVIFSGLLGTVFFQVQSSVLRLEQQSRHLRERLTLASFMTRICEQIRPPYWANAETVFLETPEGLLVRHWEGDLDKTLAVRTNGGELLVSAPTGDWKWLTLENPTAGFWTNDDKVIGLELTWKEEGETRVLRLPWGARTL